MALLRLEARPALPLGTEPELIIRLPGSGAERVSPLPAPERQQDMTQLAFPAPQAAVEHPDATFELRLDTDMLIDLPRPEELETTAPQPMRTARADSVAGLRRELRDARIRLDDEERRADEAYRSQVMAEERTAEARAALSAASARADALEAQLSEIRKEADAERLAAEARAAQLEREAGELTRTAVDARAALEAARTDAASWRERFEQLGQESHRMQERLEAAVVERDASEERTAELAKQLDALHARAGESAETGARAAELDRQTSTLTTALLEARKDLESARAEAAKWREQFERLGQEAVRLQGRLETLSTAREQAVDKAAELQQQLDAAVRAWEASDERVNALEQQLDGAPAGDGEAERLRVELQLVQQSAVQMEAEFQRLGAQSAQATAGVREMSAALRAAETELHRVRGRGA